MSFVHLNVRTAYSLLNGACRIKELCARAAALGQTALAITDTAALYGAVEFYDECVKNGIKPIVGCEVRLSGSGSRPSRLILLCRNAGGFRSLCRIISAQTPDNNGEEVSVPKDFALEHAEGLTALLPMEGTELSRLLESGAESDALRELDRYKAAFGGEVYLEITNHGLREESEICARTRELSRRSGVPAVPTNSVHYAERSDSDVQRVLSCIKRGKRLSDFDPEALPNSEYYLKSEDEMRLMFTDEELARTAEIAAKCSFAFEFGVTKLPLYNDDTPENKAAYLADLCRRGALRRYGRLTAGTEARLSHELSVIDAMGFTDYFLIVWDLVKYAKKAGIAVGPGRGSAAGSLCAYSLGITDTDPLRFSLLFERFLNPERVSMPDIDIDFCAERRDEVVDYVVRRYGASRVAQIIAFDTLKVRAAVRDAGRVLGTSANKVDSVCALLPRFSYGDVSLKKELEGKELSRLYDSDSEIKRLIDTAMRIEGLPRNVTVHAPGILITREPVSEYVPVNDRGGARTAQFPAPQLERLGLLKMDLLSLRNLTVIDKTCKAIRETQPDFDIRRIDENDAQTFAMLGRGETGGVFQFESEGITSLLTRLKPRSVEDLAAANALYRPGPMDSIPAYLGNRHKPASQIPYRHPLLKPVLEVTYGCIVYQEQVMQICRAVAGYSYGRADIVRRAMSKKKHDVMDKERQAFVYGSDTNIGAVNNGVPEKTANEIFDELVKFASYAFNKSHSAAYAQVAYQTAYLRCHYYVDYMCALITNAVSDGGAYGRAAYYIADLRTHKVRLLLPDINKSAYEFRAENGCVRFGFSGVKGLSEPFMKAVIEERGGGDFTSAADFAVRMYSQRLSRRILETLIMSGCFDGLGENRKALFDSADGILDYAARESDRLTSGQLDLFGDDPEQPQAFSTKPSPDFTAVEKLNAEREYLGQYISAHPAQVYLPRAYPDCMYIEDALLTHRNAAVALTALCTSARPITDRNGNRMFFADFEDSTGVVSAVMFSDKLREYGRPRVGTVYCIRGRMGERRSDRSARRSGATEAPETFPGAESPYPGGVTGAYPGAEIPASRPGITGEYPGAEISDYPGDYPAGDRNAGRGAERSLTVERLEAAENYPEKPLRKLYVLLSSRDDPRAESVGKILLANRGISEAVICFEDTRKSTFINGLRGVRISEKLINELTGVCGAGRVRTEDA